MDGPLCSCPSSTWAPGMRSRSSRLCLREESVTKPRTALWLTGRSRFTMQSYCKYRTALSEKKKQTEYLPCCEKPFTLLHMSCPVSLPPWRSNGKINSIEGVAKVRNASQPAILDVSFFKGKYTKEPLCLTFIIQHKSFSYTSTSVSRCSRCSLLGPLHRLPLVLSGLLLL